MPILVRKALPADLPVLEQIFRRIKIEKELNWLFSDPAGSGEYNAYVAVDENGSIVGTIAWTVSDYVFNGNVWRGVIPMSWTVEPQYQGLLGIQLMKKVLRDADFHIAIGGSVMAQKLYPAFRYKPVGDASSYLKLLKPFSYYRSLSSSPIKNLFNTFRLLPSWFFWKPFHSEKIDLEVVHELPDFVEPQGVLTKKIDKGLFDWFKNCPLLTFHAFAIRVEGETCGILLTYLKEGRNKILRGRIVHITCMQDEGLRVAALTKAVDAIKSLGCASVSVLGHAPGFTRALRKSGFKNIRNRRKPAFIADQKGVLPEGAMKNWHIQFSEGDKAYRDI